MTRRPAVLALALVLSTTALGVATPQRAEASCVGPVIAVGSEVDDRGAAPDAVAALPREAVVSGVWFREGCDDTSVTPRPGCGALAHSEEEPMRDVELVLTQGEESWSLGSADAGSTADRYAVTWEVVVPAGAAPGPATITAGGVDLAVDLAATG